MISKQGEQTKARIDENLAKALVVGGAGFIGSYLCKALLSQNCQVYCLDNLITGSQDKIKELYDDKNFYFFKHDATKSLTPLSLPKFDYIFYLAGLEPRKTRENLSIEALLVNSQGVKNLLELSKNIKAKFLLVSTVYVNSFLKKENPPLSLEANFQSLTEAKRFSEALTLKYFQSDNLDCRIVRLVDVYGPGMSLEGANLISQFINQIFENKPLQIKGEGEELLYPVYVEDVVLGILKAMFSSSSKAKIYTLAGQPISVVSFAHLVQRLAGPSTVQIEYIAPASQADEHHLAKEFKSDKQDLNWQTKVSVEEGIKKTLANLQNIKKKQPARHVSPKASELKVREALETPKSQEIMPKHKSIRDKSLSWLIKLALVFLLPSMIFLAFPFLLFYHYSVKGLGKLEALQKNDTQPLEVRKALEEGNQILLKMVGAFPVLQRLKTVNQITSLYDRAILITECFASQQAASNSLHDLFSFSLVQSNGNIQEKTNNLNLALADFWQKTSLLSGEQTLTNDSRLKIFNDIGGKLNLWKAGYQQKIDFLKAKEVLSILPELLAGNEKKNYLVLFQDNLELRPTGGFLTAFGLLTVEKGRVIDFQVEDSFSIDDEIKGKIEPPPGINKYLGETAWHFRDSNWKADFVQSAADAEWFFGKAQKREISGTFALNWNFVKDLLAVFGPIKLLQSNEIITADNLIERALKHSEIDLNINSGLSPSNNFFGQVSVALLEKLKNRKPEEYFKLVKIISNSLESKDLLLTSHDQSVMAVFDKFNWTGSVRTSAKAFTDFLMLVDANVAVNKTNYFVDQSLNHYIMIDSQGSISEKLQITWDNKSTSEGWPAGRYKNYFRAFMPINVKLLEIKVGDSLDKLETVGSDKAEIIEEEGKKTIVFYLEVMPKKQKILEINYQSGNQLSLNNPSVDYVFYWQKQPGSKNSALSFTIDYPSSLKPTELSQKAEYKDGKIIFNTQVFDKDKLFSVKFKREDKWPEKL